MILVIFEIPYKSKSGPCRAAPKKLSTPFNKILWRNHSNGQFNTTLEDDVFEDSISAPNSAKPLLHETTSEAKNQPTQYFPHLYNISPYGMFIKRKKSNMYSINWARVNFIRKDPLLDYPSMYLYSIEKTSTYSIDTF